MWRDIQKTNIHQTLTTNSTDMLQKYLTLSNCIFIHTAMVCIDKVDSES